MILTIIHLNYPTGRWLLNRMGANNTKMNSEMALLVLLRPINIFCEMSYQIVSIIDTTLLSRFNKSTLSHFRQPNTKKQA